MAWIASEMGLLLVEDGDNGRARVVSAGGRATSAGSLGDVLRTALTMDEGAPLEALLAAARSGIRGALALEAPNEGQLLAWPLGPGRARAMFTPADAPLRRRAEAAEHAAGVTHEIANALTSIAGWSQLAAADASLPEDTQRALEVVERSAVQALRAARGLLRTFRTDEGEANAPPATPAGPVEVCRALKEVLDESAPTLNGKALHLERSLPREAWAAIPRPDLLLIARNLVINAAEALRPGGTVRVGVERRGGEVLLSVEDDGPGMSAEVLSRVFDRYFTTKSRGTGLGLALVRSTVEAHDGRLEVDSQVGVGTRFEVTLPSASSPIARLPSLEPAAPTTGSHPRLWRPDLRVLLVDDDPGLRSLVRTALELWGMAVVAVGTPRDALAADGTFDIALVDLFLGDEAGDALLRTLRDRGSVTTRVLMTGSAELDLARAGEPDAVLRKPFEIDDLATLLEELTPAGARHGALIPQLGAGVPSPPRSASLLHRR